MTEQHQRSSAGTEGPYAWRCCDRHYPYIYGIVTDRQVTVDAWREGGIEFQALYPAPAQPTVDQQLEEAGKAAIMIRNELDRVRAERDSWEAQFHSAAAAASEYSEFWEKHQRDFDQFGNYIPYSQMDGDLRAAKAEIEQLKRSSAGRANARIGKWLSAALEDPNVCAKMKADIRAWFNEVSALEQIAIVCTDNMDANCNHRMALDFVRQVANDALEGIGSEPQTVSGPSAGTDLPDGYRKLAPHLPPCRCPKLWRDENGSYWCCTSPDDMPEGGK